MLDKRQLFELLKLEMRGQFHVGSPEMMAMMQGGEVPTDDKQLPQADVRALEPEEQQNKSEGGTPGMDTSALDPVFGSF